MTNPAEYITGRTVQEQMNQLISYVDTRAAEVATSAIASDVADVAQAKTDAESARDAAIAAKDTAVSTVSDCVKLTPAAAQTITAYPLTVSQGVTADVTGNVTGNVTGDVTGNVTGNVTGDIASSGSSSFTGSVTVPTVATGTNDTKAANGTKVKNELDAYSAMVRTTGNQTIAGYKSFAAGVFSDFIGRPAGDLGANNNYIMVTYPRNTGVVSRFEVVDYSTGGFVKLDAILSTNNITDGTVMAVRLGNFTLSSGDFMYGYDSDNIYVIFRVKSWHNIALRTIITRGNSNTLITPTLSYVVNPDISGITTTDAVVS